MAGSRLDQIPVHVPVPVEAAGEVAAQRYEYMQPRGRGCMETQQTNPWEKQQFLLIKGGQNLRSNPNGVP